MTWKGCDHFQHPTRGVNELWQTDLPARGHLFPCGRLGLVFRMQLVGYFEGLDSERGIAWRCADSLSLREFLGTGLTGSVPDYFQPRRRRRSRSVISRGPVGGSIWKPMGRCSPGCCDGWPGPA